MYIYMHTYMHIYINVLNVHFLTLFNCFMILLHCYIDFIIISEIKFVHTVYIKSKYIQK